MRYFLLTTLICVASFLKAQESTKDSISPWILNIGVGYYMSDDATAAYYNGSDNSRLSQMLSPQNSPYYNSVYEQVKQSLEGYDFTIQEYAQDMTYLNAASFELGLSYQLKNNWNIAVRFFNTKLNAAGIFTLNVQRLNTGNNPGVYNLEEVNISGTESRSHIVIAGGKKWLLAKNIYLPIEFGFNMNFVEVKRNEFLVENRTYSLPIYNDLRNPQAQQNTTFGNGVTASAGLRYQVPSGLGFEIKCTYFNTKINVNDLLSAQSTILLPSIGFTKAF